MLVETSNDKNPSIHLGNSLDVLNRDTEGNGHVSRNIRLALSAADMVEPYVGIVGVNKLALTDDVVPMTKHEPNSCVDTKAVMVAQNANKVDIEWTVGGAMTIDSTELWYAKWDDVVSERKDSCWTQPDSTDFLQQVAGAAASSGSGFFSVQGSQPRPEESATGIRMTNGPLFRTSIPLEKFQEGDKVMIMASARVDQSWKNQPEKVLPSIPPQSHIVNARTDPNYHHESNGKHIQGRLDWFSVPITVVIGDFKDSVGTRGVDSVNAIEIHSRFVDNRSINTGGVKPKSAKKDQLWFPFALWKYLVGIVLVVSFSICCLKWFCSRDNHNTIKVKQEDSPDDSVFEQNSYSDQTNDEYGDYDDESDDGIEIPSIL